MFFLAQSASKEALKGNTIWIGIKLLEYTLETYTLWQNDYLSRVMRKPVFCIIENKDADQ